MECGIENGELKENNIKEHRLYTYTYACVRTHTHTHTHVHMHAYTIKLFP